MKAGFSLLKMQVAMLALAGWSALADPYTNSTYQLILEWEPSVDATVTGYRVYCSTNSFYDGSSNQVVQPTNALVARVDAGSNVTATLTGLRFGVTHYSVVTAYNAAGLESDYSNQVDYTLTKPKPPVLRVKVWVALESARQVEGPWRQEVVFPEYVASTEGEEAVFFRAKLTAVPEWER